MNSRICRCCGEPMPETGNALSRNPNICASCSSMADGMEEASPPESAGHLPSQELGHEVIEADVLYGIQDKVAESAAHH